MVEETLKVETHETVTVVDVPPLPGTGHSLVQDEIIKSDIKINAPQRDINLKFLIVFITIYFWNN